MKVEHRAEQFKEHSLIGSLLRQLHIDIPLLIGLLLLLVLSFMMLYSTGNKEAALLIRQSARMGIAGVLMIALAHVDPRQFQRFSILLYSAGVILLVAVLLVGDVGKGAQRWLDLGFFRFQPSEMIKITTPMMIAWYLSGHEIPPKWQHVLIASAFILIPTLLIVRQPDLGTSLLVASSGVSVLYFAGLSWRFLLTSVLSLAALAPVYWHFIMREYQKDRVLTF